MSLLSPEKKLEKKIVSRFNKALYDYGLIEDGDRILVGLSGGKDSLCLLNFLAQRRKIKRPSFEIEALHIRMSNIKYETDAEYLDRFCSDRGVRLHVVTTGFDSSTDNRKSPCFLCSWNRRKQMFTLARQLSFNKIALGHHMDDIIHTAMMNVFFQGSFSTMPVRLKMRKMPVTIIRPLCLEEETDLRMFAEASGYKKQKKICPYDSSSHRMSMRNVFSEIENLSSEARYSVWTALEKAGRLIEE